MTLDEPLAVEGFSERQQGKAQPFDGVEGSNPEKLLFESSDLGLGTAISLRGTGPPLCLPTDSSLSGGILPHLSVHENLEAQDKRQALGYSSSGMEEIWRLPRALGVSIGALFAFLTLVVVCWQRVSKTRLARSIAALLPDWSKPGQRPYLRSLLLFAAGLFILLLPGVPLGPASPVLVESVLIGPEFGHAYLIPMEKVGILGLSDSEGNSDLVLFEDGVPLREPHSSHDRIRTEGKGSYSHWGRNIYFSSSDNSDPQSNGRRYSYRVSHTIVDKLPDFRGRRFLVGLASGLAGSLLMTLSWLPALPRAVRAITGRAQWIVPGLREVFPDWNRPGPWPYLHSLLLSVAGVLIIWLPNMDVGPASPVMVDSSLIRSELAHAYLIPMEEVGVVGLSDREGRSDLTLYEGGVPLREAHSSHDQIRSEGEGRYSHWGRNIYFSSSDNTDPRSNGRRYSYHVSQTIADKLPAAEVARAPVIILSGLVGGAVMLLPWFSALRREGLRAWIECVGGPILASWCVIGGVAGLLWLNLMNPKVVVVAVLHGLLSAGLVFGSLVIVFLGRRGYRRFVRKTGSSSGIAISITMMMAVIPAFAGLLLAAEAAARVRPAETSQGLDPGLKFFWPEWLQPRNSLGHNDREVGEKSVPRVMVLGDSFTEGAGVRFSERFTKVLEDRIQAQGIPVEVVNAGNCGFDTIDEAHRLEATGDAIRPDVVVVAYVLNDAEGADPPSRKPLGEMEHLTIVRMRSYLFFRLFMTGHHWRLFKRESKDPANRPIANIVLSQHSPDSEGWHRVQEGLKRIREWCDERGVRKVLVVYPTFVPNADMYRSVMDQVVQEAKEQGFEARSALDDFEERWQDYGFTAFDPHPGPGAHRIMGERLAGMLGRIDARYNEPVASTSVSTESQQEGGQ